LYGNKEGFLNLIQHLFQKQNSPYLWQKIPKPVASLPKTRRPLFALMKVESLQEKLESCVFVGISTPSLIHSKLTHVLKETLTWLGLGMVG
jgi:hypothetical protein